VNLPGIKPTPEPPDSRIIPLARPEGLTNQVVEQLRFGLGNMGPLPQAVLNNNVGALVQALPFGITASSGMIVLFMRKTTWVVPTGWLACDGGVVEKLTYPSLYAMIGATIAETATTFTLPTIANISSNLRYIVKI